MTAYHPDTICAVATAPGRGGVGIVRISGPLSREIALTMLGFSPKPRHAHYTEFHLEGSLIDQGIALFFPAPHSFTGEDVLELQGHGGPVVLDLLVKEAIRLGARHARPGEFSERAFLNDKLDLSQAEAIADLIDASSAQAAKQALNALRGAFSQRINALLEQMIQLRVYVESAIDFPEEEIDFLSDGKIASMLSDLIEACELTLAQARQGVLLREGMTVVIAGRPNAGKSSLLNALAGDEVAIVTDIAGTTRDLIRQHLILDGLPLHVIDTAGLRDTDDVVERIGVGRAWEAICGADRILLLIDSSDPMQRRARQHWPEFFERPELRAKLTLVYNKIDLAPAPESEDETPHISVSAKSGEGLAALSRHLQAVVGYESNLEGGFSARRRHLHALERALTQIRQGEQQLAAGAGELLAEDLRSAQDALGEITGKFTADDLLGEIFSRFCIGK